MEVVVTGAAGAVGSYVVNLLADEGHLITATDLPGRPIPNRKGVTPYPLDLVNGPTKEFKEIVRGTVGVIHTAAIVDIGKSFTEVWPLNVTATRKLATAASEEPLCKFIHISSGSIYAPSKGPISESHRLLVNSPYEASKVRSEAIIQVVGENAANDFSWTILRPALIYGPRARFLGATLAAIPPILELFRLTRIGVREGRFSADKIM